LRGGNIACQGSPGSDVQQNDQFNVIQGWQQGREENTQPNHGLVVHQMQNIFGNFELAIFGLQIIIVLKPQHITKICMQH